MLAREASGHLWSPWRLFMALQAQLLSAGGPMSFWTIRLNVSKTTPTPWIRAEVTGQIPGKFRKVEAKPKKTGSRRTAALIGCRKDLCPSSQAQGKRTENKAALSVGSEFRENLCLDLRKPWVTGILSEPERFDFKMGQKYFSCLIQTSSYHGDSPLWL